MKLTTRALSGMLIILLMFFLSCTSERSLKKTELSFILLPEQCSTPDGLAINNNGDLLLTCPNYADPSKKACILRIDSSFNVSLFYEFEPLEATGLACPMGIDVASNGDIYICDNQGWAGTDEGQFKGRLLKLRMSGTRIDTVIEVATGMEHPNGVKVRDNYIYVTQSMLTKVEDSTGLLTSGVYRFSIDDENIVLENTRKDKNLLVTFRTYNKYCQYGLDGLVFDSKGSLIVGNFGDGTLHKISFGRSMEVNQVELLAKTDFDYTLDPETENFLEQVKTCKMRTTDGICIDEKDNVYVADFSNNAINKVSPEGNIEVILQHEDNDGSEGKLNQPGEPIIFGDNLIIANFDMVLGPDKVNSQRDPVSTLTILNLNN